MISDLVEKIYDGDAEEWIPVKVLKEYPVNGALFQLVEVESNDWVGVIARIVWQSGEQVTTYDWQSPQPTSIDEIRHWEWCGMDGRPCIWIDGLPRIFP